MIDKTLRRGGRARLKASDSKSDRGVSPSGVQILSPPPISESERIEQAWRGGRVAEGAALEMPCRGNSTVGSNPTPSAIFLMAVENVDGPLSSPIGEKGPVARRRPKAAGEVYSLYVEPAAE